MALRLNGSSSGYVELEVPADAGSHTLTLPDGGGTSGQYLQTNGSGTLSWQTLTTGSILQVVQAYKNDVFSTSTLTTWEDITGLSVAITPSATTSEVLVLVDVRLGFSAGELAQLRLRRGSTTVGSSTIGTTGNGFSHTDSDAYSAQTRVMATNTMTFLDSPSTTASTTYQVQMWKDGSNTAYVNRRGINAGHGACSSITLLEVAA
jgi:hypothetical protein